MKSTGNDKSSGGSKGGGGKNFFRSILGFKKAATSEPATQNMNGVVKAGATKRSAPPGPGVPHPSPPSASNQDITTPLVSSEISPLTGKKASSSRADMRISKYEDSSGFETFVDDDPSDHILRISGIFI